MLETARGGAQRTLDTVLGEMGVPEGLEVLGRHRRGGGRSGAARCGGGGRSARRRDPRPREAGRSAARIGESTLRGALAVSDGRGSLSRLIPGSGARRDASSGDLRTVPVGSVGAVWQPHAPHLHLFSTHGHGVAFQFGDLGNRVGKEGHPNEQGCERVLVDDRPMPRPDLRAGPRTDGRSARGRRPRSVGRWRACCPCPVRWRRRPMSSTTYGSEGWKGSLTFGTVLGDALAGFGAPPKS